VNRADFSDWEGTAGTTVIARMAAGPVPERANAELAPIARALHDANPDVFGDEFMAAATVTPLQRATVGSFRTTLWVLLGAVSLVLLIACANVANLLLAHGESRSQELAIRRSLGASAWRLLRQLMTESTLLGLLGGALGYGLAWLALWAFRAHVTAAVPLGDRVGLNGTVLAFALVTSLVTAVLFGLWPAVRALRPDLRESLQGGGRHTGRGMGSRGMNRTLMAFEVALSVVLLTGAGLLIKSSWLLQRVDTGFRSENLLTLRVNLPGGRYEEDAARVEYFRRLEEQVAAVPGVLRVGSMSYLPLTTRHMSTLFTVEDRPVQEGAPRSYAMIQSVMPGLGEALGTRLLRGRWLDPTDRADAPKVCVINQAMATAAFGSEDPLGRQIQLFGWFDASVVGIVADVREIGLDRPVQPEAILAYPQLPGFGVMSVVIRTAGAPQDLIPSVVAAIAALDRDVPITQVATMDAVLRASMADSRLTTMILSLFAAIAFVLSVVGVYGVISYTVSARTFEIGVRMAMGAGRGTVVREIMAGALVPLSLGVAGGIGAAVALGRVIETQLYEIGPRDPTVLVVGAVSLLIAGVAASVVPARRAAAVDPMRCLNG
jgi:putative ABC transport system permease protein